MFCEKCQKRIGAQRAICDDCREATLTISFISYILYQNEPSDPQITDLRWGHIKEDLKKLFLRHVDGKVRVSLKVQKEEYSPGHLYLQEEGADDPYVFVTFREEDKDKAFSELKI
jgi:hypothetical protein